MTWALATAAPPCYSGQRMDYQSMAPMAPAPPAERDQVRTLIGTIVLIIAVGAVGFWLGRSAERSGWAGFGRLPAGTGYRQEGAPAEGAVLAGGNAIAVSDQPPGMTVSVSFVALAQDGWVVIHEDADGTPGRILGAQRFAAGQGQSGNVELLRGAEEGKVYYAMLHADDGEPGFDHVKDLPLQDPQGNVILMRFVAQARPAE